MAKRLAVIDASVSNLLPYLDTSGFVGARVVLHDNDDPLAQIGVVLDHFGAVDVLDIYAHGSPGRLILAGRLVDQEYLAGEGLAQANWSSRFNGRAELHLHACCAGHGDVGVGLMEALRHALGVSVRAPDGDLGGQDANCQWMLDRQAGEVRHELHPAINYPGTLALIAGTPGADSLTGTDQDDNFLGSMGIDVLDGGAGIDTLVMDLDLSALPQDGSGLVYTIGTTSLGTASSYGAISAALPSLASGSAFTISIAGGLFSTSTLAIELFNISLTGSSNNDLLILQSGTRYWGGTGTDTFYADRAADPVGVVWENNPSLVQTVFGSSISEVERLLLRTGAGADLLANDYAGNNTADHFDTGAGNDTVRGGAGNDTYLTGDGNDQVVAGSGNNTINLGTGNDVVQVDGIGIDVIDGGTGLDQVIGRIDYSGLAGGGFGMVYSFFPGGSIFSAASSFTAINAERALGSNNFTIANQNLLSFNRTTAINVESITLDLIGSARDDLLIQTGGTEYRGGGGTDTLYADFWFRTTDVSFVNSAIQDVVLDGVTYAGVERLLMRTGSGNDVIDNASVTATADYIDSGAGNDTIDAGPGNDILIAGAGQDLVTTHVGNDNVSLGDDDDTVIGSLGLDTLNGGTGIDVLELHVDYSGLLGGLGLQVATTTSGGRMDAATVNFATVHDSMAGVTAGLFIGRDLQMGTTALSMEVIHADITGSSFDDLILLLGGTQYDGGVGIDTFYADWSAAVDGISWINTPTQAQVVQGVSIAGMERLLVAGGTGNDLIDNRLVAATPDQIVGAAGDDTLAGGGGGDTLIGGAGNDLLVTGVGADVALADEGDDTVVASLGLDVLDGALGSDTLQLDLDYSTLATASGISYTMAAAATLLNATSSMDEITAGLTDISSFGIGIGPDHYLTATGFETISGSIIGSGAADLLIWQGGDDYRGGNGNDTFYADWSALLDPTIWINNPTSTKTLHGAGISGVERLLVATGAASDRIDNTGSPVTTNDEFRSGAGNDTLNGGLGIDTMIGGQGNDVYVASEQGDVITELAGEGIDFIQAGFTYSMASLANVERLTLTGLGDINGTGNNLDNLLFGNAGNNVLIGGAGVDTLNGADGTDTLVGGAGNDVYVLDSITDTINELVNQGVDLVQSSVTQSGLAANVEQLQLTGSTNIDGSGNALFNLLTGNLGDNMLNALGGNDTLIGGAGIDTLIGGLGNDVYQVDSQTDVIIELAGEGTDFIQTSITYSMAGTANVERLTMLGNAAINGTGSDEANMLFGNTAGNVLSGALGNDTLNGGDGIDTLIGGLGNDVYQVDSITDVISENGEEGIDFVQSLVDYDLSRAANVERLTLLGGAGINGTGNDLDNVLFGNAGNNSLRGGWGADVLNGAAGLDTMEGGQGNDVYQIDSLTDTLIEGLNEGTDTVQTSVNLAGLAANIENAQLLGVGNLTAVGNELANSLIGNGGNNILNGALGNDTLEGGAGVDTMIGGVGNDVYRVDSQSDVITELASQGTDFVQSTVTYTLAAANVENLTLLGTEAINGTGSVIANVLFGNTAANVLNGGASNDTLIGGLGNDAFMFDTALSATSNVDLIHDFTAGDHLLLSAVVFTNLGAAGALAADHFFIGAGVTGNSGTGGIYYDTTAGSMYYDADGLGGAAATRFAVVTGHPVIAAGDIIVG